MKFLSPPCIYQGVIIGCLRYTMQLEPPSLLCLSSITLAATSRYPVRRISPGSLEKCFSFHCQDVLCPYSVLCTVSDLHSLGVSAVLKQLSSAWHVNWNMSCKHEVHVVTAVKLHVDFWPEALRGVSPISQGWSLWGNLWLIYKIKASLSGWTAPYSLHVETSWEHVLCFSKLVVNQTL